MQPRIGSLFLFVTLGETFSLIGMVAVGASVWSLHLGQIAKMFSQISLALGALLAALVADGASGQAFEDLLVYIGALVRGFVPPVSDPLENLY